MSKDEALGLLNSKKEYFIKAYNSEFLFHDKQVNLAIIEALTDKLFDIKNLIEEVETLNDENIDDYSQLKRRIRMIC